MRTPYPNELMHYGVKGMKKGVRQYQNADGSLTPLGREHYGVGERGSIGDRLRTTANSIKDKAKNTTSTVKNKLSEQGKSEVGKRGKAALDVLMNGDTDWMGNRVSASDPRKEARNRGRAALERLMYSEDQIDNKKFFGDYNF